MKKIISILLIVIILALVGCGKAPSASTTEDAEAVSIEEEIAEIDSIEEDTDLSELENLEKELDELI